METIIQLNDIRKSFQTKAGSFTALQKTSLSIQAGEHIAITGKSGSGKSTLLNIMTGIDIPDGGEIQVVGKALLKYNESQLSKFRGSHIGVVFQFFQLIPTLTVIENIRLPMDLVNKIPKKNRQDRAKALLLEMGLENHHHKFPSELSGGEQQRVAIARSLSNDPQIIAADEPTGNLDSQTSEIIFNLFHSLVEKGRTVIVVTHEKIKKDQYGRILTLSDGRIINDTGATQNGIQNGRTEN
jgi:putative ABC transport system ATP-binding protein